MIPLPREQFEGLDTHTWLYTGAEGPLHRGVRAAVEEYLDHRTGGPGGRAFNAALEESCRGRLAQLMNCDYGDIALLSNSSEAIASVIASLRCVPGDNIVVNTLEFPSGMLAALAARESGIEARIVQHRDWKITSDDLLAQVDDRTRLVITSHVSYLSGARIDAAALYKELQQRKALLLLDATQSLGVVPVNAKLADFTVASSYKWTLAMHGVGVLAVNPQRTADLAPTGAGWRGVPDLFSKERFKVVERFDNARRYELGFPAFGPIAALNFSSRFLMDAGIENIEKHVLRLGEIAIETLSGLGLQVMTPRHAAERAGNIAFVCTDGEGLAAALQERGILLWGGDGRARLSIHGFNDEDDIDKTVEAIREVLGR